jgi:bacterioferritin-associated ferredoxin
MILKFILKFYYNLPIRWLGVEEEQVMIVCLCHAVSSSMIERIRQQGCDSLRQLQKQCSAGSSCGACIQDLKKALKEGCCSFSLPISTPKSLVSSMAQKE